METPSRLCTIYHDPEATLNHNPDYGSFETGARVDIDVDAYANHGHRIVIPSILSRRTYKSHLVKINSIHSANSLVTYLQSKPFTPNFFQRHLRLTPRGKKRTNCAKCTMEFSTSSSRCKMCDADYHNGKFYRFAHLIDPEIIESDTTYVSETSWTAVVNAVDLVCQMVDDFVTRSSTGFAIIRPPGHHACTDKSGGFCIVNNIAIAANYAIYQGFKRVFIFDFDAHHGNGTQEIFYKRSDVFYCSIHTMDAYPKTGSSDEIGKGQGKGFTCNITVPKGVEPEDYLKEFHQTIIPMVTLFDPDIILVSAGFDGLATDPMAIMKLIPETYAEIATSLKKQGVALGFVLEGGYNIPDLMVCYEKVIIALSD